MNGKSARIVLLFVAFVAMIVVPAFAEGLSRAQGDAILTELRQIRQLLEKQQKQGAPSPAAPEAPERVRLKIGKEHSVGREDAPVIMVEYTDYQCPFCNRFHTSTYPELKKRYIDTGKLRFITRDLPLDFHQHAMKAAQATHCAGEEGKFWQMKDLLMTNYARLTPDLITSLAGDAGVTMIRFKACMDQDKFMPEIKEGASAAQAVGIQGTPSFIVGKVSGDYVEGFKIIGAQPFSKFDSLIKELLAQDK